MIDNRDFINYLTKGEVPPEPPVGGCPQDHAWGKFSNIGDRMDNFAYRDKAIGHGMWAIIDMVWTKTLAEWIGSRTCLEVMAGAGWLAKALNEQGIDIIATDNGEWKGWSQKYVFSVETLDAVEAVKKYCCKDALIISWPPFNDETICRVCEMWGSKKPIVYIGEEQGCNAPEEFFANFHPLSSHPNIPLMTWYAIYDKVIIGHYK